MDGTKPVSVRCDVFLRLVEEIEKSAQLRDLMGTPVSEALVIVAENDDLRIEDGGGTNLSVGEKKRLREELNRLTNAVEGVSSEAGGGRRPAEGERVRTRCDVLAGIIRDLGAARELREIYGGSVLENLVVLAEGGDLRIENSGAVKLTEGQSCVFLGILNRIIEEHIS